MVRTSKLFVRMQPRSFAKQLLERFVRHQRIDEGAVHRLADLAEGFERHVFMELAALIATDDRLGDPQPVRQLRSGHAERIANSAKPSARGTREIGIVAHRGQAALKMLSGSVGSDWHRVSLPPLYALYGLKSLQY